MCHCDLPPSCAPPRMYLLNGQPSVELPVPLLASNPHFGLEMEDDDLVITYFAHCLGQDFGSLHMGFPTTTFSSLATSKTLSSSTLLPGLAAGAPLR